jgi:hypothetical protein
MIGSTTVLASAEELAVAGRVVEWVSAGLGLSPEIQGCVVSRLAVRPDLLDRVRSGVAADSPEVGEIGRLRDACGEAAGFGSAFAGAAVNGSGTPLSQADRDCLRSGYLGLSEDDVRALTAGAVDPNGGSQRSASVVIGQRLYEACGLTVPR